VEEYEYDTRDTPCGAAIDREDIVFIPDKVVEIFPGDNDLRHVNAASYIGAPLFDESNTRILGHVGVLDSRPMPEADSFVQIFKKPF
jgi:hypothetical protein